MSSRRLAGALTPRGWLLAATSVLLLPAGALVGVQELYAVGVAGMVALVGAALWVRSVPWALDVRRRVHPQHIAAGERPVADIDVHNPLLRPSPVVALVDPLRPATHHDRERLLAPIDVGATVSYRYHLPAASRGVYAVGPLVGSVTDPLGLAVRRRPLAPAQRVIVHPATPLDGGWLITGGTGWRGGLSLADAGADNDEFSTLREYRPGDDLRRIHWASSARTDTLLVREDEQDHRGKVVLVLDMRSTTWTAAGFEAGLEAAASVAVAGFNHGLQLRLLTSGGTDTGLGSGAAHRGRVLDELAVAATHRGGPLTLGPSRRRTAPPRGLRAGDTTIVVTSDRVDADDQRQIRELAQHSPLTVLVVQLSRDGQRSAAAFADGRRIRVVRLRERGGSVYP